MQNFYFGLIIVFIFIILTLISIRSKLRKNNKTIFAQNEKIFIQKTELENHRNHLEQIVQQRTKDLKIALEKAEESDKLKTAFLENISHEIRTPLNAIVGFSNLLQNEKQLTEIVYSYVNHIKIGSNDLLHIVESILTMSKIQTREYTIKKERFAIDELMNQIFIEIQLSVISKENSNIELKLLKSEVDNLFIDSDENCLRIIINNLIKNAFESTERGLIKLEAKVVDRNVVFIISDTGKGIKNEDTDTIFNKFIKLDSDKSKLKSGLGLGLTISKELINLLGGKIWVDSDFNTGSTFYFTIPID